MLAVACALVLGGSRSNEILESDPLFFDPAKLEATRQRGRIHGLIAVHGVGGITAGDLTGGLGLQAELGTVLADRFILATSARLTTTIVTRSQLWIGAQFGYVLHELIVLGAGAGAFISGAVFRLPNGTINSPLTITDPQSLNVMLELRAAFTLFRRLDTEWRRSSVVLLVAVAPGFPALATRGGERLPFNLVGSVSLGWSWH